MQNQFTTEIEEFGEWLTALDQMKTHYKKQSETENKIKSVFKCMDTRENKIQSVFKCLDTREIIMNFKKEKIQTEKIKIEQGLIKKYFDIKLEDEIQRVKTNFARVVKGEYLISSPRDLFQSNFKRHLQEDIRTELIQAEYEEKQTFKYIFEKNEDVVRRKTHSTLKKFTVACEKYFEIMETRSVKKNIREQFIIEHEGVEYKLFNRAGRRVKSEINKNFLEQYIEEDVCTDMMDKKFRRGLREYGERYK